MKACIRAFVGLVAVGGVWLGMLSVVPADDKTDKKGTNIQEATKDTKEAASSKAMASIELANSLIRWGREEKNAEALLLAAQIIHKTPTDKLKAERTVTGGKAEKTAKAAKMSNTPKALIAEARKLSSAPQVEALAQATGKMLEETTRGAAPGPKVDSFYIGAFQTINWNPITFYANERAEVYISVGAQSRMVLEVFDENGNVVARDSVPGNYYRCVWNPRWTGPFRVRLTSNDSFGFNCGLATN